MRRCCVPGCRSNKAKPYVSVFQFPKTPSKRDIWLQKIGASNLKISENIGVCIKHFDKDYVIQSKDLKGRIRKRAVIKNGAVPTIFEDFVDGDESLEIDIEDEDTDDSLSSPEKTPPKPSSPVKKIIKSPIKPGSKRALNCLPSPYKHFPSVSVCLKEEDRLNAQRELGKVKRTTSTGSNVSSSSDTTFKSNTSSDATIQSIGNTNDSEPKDDSKSEDGPGAVDDAETTDDTRATRFGELKRINTQDAPRPKKKRIERPPPLVIGKKNDCYCWGCHRENVVLNCVLCKRAFHQKCAGRTTPVVADDCWFCPVCEAIDKSTNMDLRSCSFAEITRDKLAKHLRMCLNKMKQTAGVAFHQPVSLEHYPMYHHYVINPMDFSLLERNIKNRMYGSTYSFLADVKWIMHNSCVFNGSQHPLSVNAKSMVKACESDMQEIEVCADCFTSSVIRNKDWFTEVCKKPHPLVWAKLKGFPYWPAKVAKIENGNIDARFFGAHDRALVPVSQCYHLSKEMPTSSKPKKKGHYENALEELDQHVKAWECRFGKFVHAPYRTPFNVENEFLMYHGVDFSKILREDNTKKSSSAKPENALKGSENNEKSSNTCMKTRDNSLVDLDSSDSSDKEISMESVASKITDCTESVKDNIIPEKAQISSVTKKAIPSDSSQLKTIDIVFQKIKGLAPLSKANNEKSPVKDKIDKCINESEVATISKSSAEASSDNADNCTEKESAEATAAKKNDLFALKLSETIASCKAKLGLSESSMYEQTESETDSGEDEEEDEEDEHSNEEGKVNGKKAEKESVSEEDNQYSSADEDESNEESSNTDIESSGEVAATATSNKQTPSKDNNKMDIDKTHDVVAENDESMSSITEVEEISFAQKVASKDQTKNSKSNQEVHSDEASDAEIETIVNSSTKKDVPENNQETATISTKIDSPEPMEVDDSNDEPEEHNEGNKTECEDDDIYICPPPKVPTPPLICLDDDDEPDGETTLEKVSPQSSNTRTLRIRTLKAASGESAQSFLTTNRTKRGIVYTSSEEDSNTSSSSEDERPVSPPALPLTGAKRTFNRNSQLGLAKRSPAQQIPFRIDEPQRPVPPVVATPEVPAGASILKPTTSTPVVIDPIARSNDAEQQQSLQRKTSRLVAQFRWVLFKHKQEKEELMHNMNVLLMEMRASFEADKKQAIQMMAEKFEKEKALAVAEVKKKQWCAQCSQESRYACCWNTSYCSLSCQKIHIIRHGKVCGQMQIKNRTPTVSVKSPLVKDKLLLLNIAKDNKLKLPITSQQPGLLKPIASPKGPLHLVQAAKIKIATKLASETVKQSPQTDDTEPEINPVQLSSDSAMTGNTTKNENTLLEETYFPSPPSVKFEGLDSSNPDDTANSESPEEIQMETDALALADSDEDNQFSESDENNSEMTSLGFGLEVKATHLKKCLEKGVSAKKLSMYLLSVLIPDEKLLATCSALGSQSHVTMLTRAALPNKKVNAIVDFVQKTFPGTTRNEIIDAINVKCKMSEARLKISHQKDRTAKLHKLTGATQAVSSTTGDDSSTTHATAIDSTKEPSAKSPTTITVPRKALSNFIRIAGSPPSTGNQSILRCNPQVMLQPATPALILPSVQPCSSLFKKSPTVKELLVEKKIFGSVSPKVVLPAELVSLKPLLAPKPTPLLNSPPRSSTVAASQQRPLIIIGSAASPSQVAGASTTTVLTNAQLSPPGQIVLVNQEHKEAKET